MKVGIIGLGRMGEGMSRRLIKCGHEVHGYRNNVAKAQEQFQKGYISGYTDSLESLVQVVHEGTEMTGKVPGVFLMVVPAETVEETLNDYYDIVVKATLLLIMAIPILKKADAGQKGCLNLASNILTVVLVVVFMVWTVDTVLWLGAEIQQSPLVRQFLMPSPQVSLPPNVHNLMIS